MKERLEVHKFLFPTMDKVSEGVSALLRALFSGIEFEEIDLDNISAEVREKLKQRTLDCIPAMGILAKTIIPAGLRLDPKSKQMQEMTAEEALDYLPEIVEVNQGFFTKLLTALIPTISKLNIPQT